MSYFRAALIWLGVFIPDKTNADALFAQLQESQGRLKAAEAALEVAEEARDAFARRALALHNEREGLCAAVEDGARHVAALHTHLRAIENTLAGQHDIYRTAREDAHGVGSLADASPAERRLATALGRVVRALSYAEDAVAGVGAGNGAEGGH